MTPEVSNAASSPSIAALATALAKAQRTLASNPSAAESRSHRH
jgi:hypothetical protein